MITANPGIQFKFTHSNGINCCQIILKNRQDIYSEKQTRYLFCEIL
jgi:hypothetical protein